jgi:hypothetical protein
VLKVTQRGERLHLSDDYNRIWVALWGKGARISGMEANMADVTLREVLEGYRRFNAWELEEQKSALQKLSVEESVRQYFELCDLARALAPDAEQIFLEQHKVHWVVRRKKFQRLAKAMKNARTTPGIARSKRVS